MRYRDGLLDGRSRDVLSPAGFVETEGMDD